MSHGMTPGLAYAHYDSPCGRLLVAGSAGQVHHIGFPAGPRQFAPRADWRAEPAQLAAAFRALDGYFAGRLRAFDLPLVMTGTPFQLRVWALLRGLGYGRTTSYGALAAALGMSRASRAVGAANGANPIPIIVPCHRVIGAGGALTGFGGGIGVKRFLLDLEAAHSGDDRPNTGPVAAR